MDAIDEIRRDPTVDMNQYASSKHGWKPRKCMTAAGDAIAESNPKRTSTPLRPPETISGGPTTHCVISSSRASTARVPTAENVVNTFVLMHLDRWPTC